MKIFVASTGRCATAFMRDVFLELTNIPSFHEFRPHCIGKTMEDLNNNTKYTEETEKELEKKIRYTLHETIDDKYCETSQAFIKSYVYRFLDEFDDIYCIYVHRTPSQVLRSWKKAKSSHNEVWHLKSHWKKNLSRTKEVLSFDKNVLWECEEIRKRYLHYKPRFKKTFEFDFRDINDPERWKELFAHFGVAYQDFDILPI